jgi:hypothetical protein
VLGVLSFLVCWIPFLGIAVSDLGLLLGFGGMVMALARRGSGIGFSIVGSALSVIPLAVSLLWTLALSSPFLLDRYEQSKLARAKIECETLSSFVETFKVNTGHCPESIEELTRWQPHGARPPAPEAKIHDPWGKLYQIDPKGPRNGGRKADVLTKSPKGKVIGNFD